MYKLLISLFIFGNCAYAQTDETVVEIKGCGKFFRCSVVTSSGTLGLMYEPKLEDKVCKKIKLFKDTDLILIKC